MIQNLQTNLQNKITMQFHPKKERRNQCHRVVVHVVASLKQQFAKDIQ